MPPLPAPPMMRAMTSYAVLWQGGDGPRMSGRLEFEPLGLRLRGADEQQAGVELRFDEIVSVERGPDVRIGPCRAIRLTSRTAGSFLVASIAGVGMLSDILWRVLGALPAASS